MSDLTKISARAIDRRRARRLCRRGWDWPAFEQEIARYVQARRGRRPTAPPPH